MTEKYFILGLPVNSFHYSGLLSEIEKLVSRSEKTAITYANAACIMNFRASPKYRCALQRFILIHSDGVGISLAARFLNYERLKRRMTGSDFYPLLIEKAIEKQWALFIFGDTIETLRCIPERYPTLKIAGMSAGFSYSNRLPEEISKLKPDLVLVGLGVPKQETWIADNWERLPAALYLAVGEGLKVLSGTKKRGNSFIQKAGFEWAVRLFSDPVRLWKRYLIWMPVFLFMVVMQKFRGKSE
ncbi:MAG: hypothetical protein AMXMBFR48_17290 [Ignavibacteriales bacterium]